MKGGCRVFLSLLKLNPLSRLVRRDIGDVTQMHRTVMSAYPQVEPGKNPREEYGVLFRLDVFRSTGEIRLYVQSRVEPNWESLPESYVLGADKDSIQVRSLAAAYDRIRNGQALRFRLRANPTVKIDTKTREDGVRRNGRRVPVRGEENQRNWLVRKGEESGFELRHVVVQGSGSAELYRDREKNRVFQGVLYDGLLVVTDSGLFRETLQKGIGPAKAFGFGLLSISPE